MKREAIVSAVAPESEAEAAGVRPGDTILSVDGEEIYDALDFAFHADEPGMEITVLKPGSGSRKTLSFTVEEPEDLGIELEDFRTRRCRNRCIFCFVDQLPRGLRKPLYLKDDDFRMSFLYGNYVTLTNLTGEERRRIVEQRLSPLYVSVHATERKLRNLMLGDPHAPDVMEELRFLKENRIEVHLQVVLCPGYNDGSALDKTIEDLSSLHPSVLSIAVVPVGVTRYSREEIRPVDAALASVILDGIDCFRERYTEKYGDPLVYGADELYLRAGRKIPPLAEYGELSQIENGVGLVALFLDDARRLRPKAALKDAGHLSSTRYLTVTGTSFYPFLEKFAGRLRREGAGLDVLPVENGFFGPTVTVAGLITGADIVRAISGRARDYDILLLPDIVMREEGDLLLDDMSPADLEAALGIPVEVVEATAAGLLDAIKTPPADRRAGVI